MMEILGGFSTLLAHVWAQVKRTTLRTACHYSQGTTKAQREVLHCHCLIKTDQWLDDVQSRMGAIRPGRFSSEIELQNGETPCLRLTRNSRIASSWTIQATL